ncbi:hypothetical protein BC833DRAFT_626447 [Globomyces pollinis-pini]|nr:hypothetical protein BC833DRAFT_626447 [Globomyces pollinis-pini]
MSSHKSKSVKKRKRREDVLFPNADNISATKRDGPWENGEIELFKAGEYGWGKWNLISQYIESRNSTQVRNFSTTVIGRRIRPSRVLTKGYLSLAAGFQVVAEELRANNYFGHSKEFTEYESTLLPGTTVVIAARMQAAFFQKKAFVQLVPVKIQVFGSHIKEEEAIEDIF